VVAVTGSVGKTSVKDLSAAVLSKGGSTHACERSFNNEIGVPLSILGAPDDADFLVLEMGARAEGDIARLTGIARPDVGVITTVAMAHTSAFGSLEVVARTKGELLDGLPPDGCAVLNSDDDLVMGQAGRARCPVLTFGERGEVRAREVNLDGGLRPSFRLESPWGRSEVHLEVHGAHMVSNALAAAAVGLFLGLSPEDVAAGLSGARLSPWRMEVATAPSGLVVVNDAYNANPASMVAGLEALASLAVAGRRIAVVGLMAELGRHEATAHREVADQADGLGIDLLAVGTDLYGVAPLAGIDEASTHLAGLALGDGDAVLVKGSRVAGLEALAARLLED
jgi:UDP-N-acetylmuramoyl-tripeptide--D-alanyl-D-alanine ligase